MDDVVLGSDGIAWHDQNRRRHAGDRLKDDGRQVEDSSSPVQSPEETTVARLRLRRRNSRPDHRGGTVLSLACALLTGAQMLPGSS